ncbi:MAG: DNA repair exonuclease [Acetobacteraceae bacterium]|nr:DNA repair exonuclease [Acetobacteraceae bacterium]
MRLLHTSDWQIGKCFAFLGTEGREILRDARLEAISRIGRLARQGGASAVLVAGDVYDVATPSDQTLRQPIERMRAFPDLAWHLIPGNHDPHSAGGPWERLARAGLPDNVRAHLTPEPAPIGDGTAWIIPAPLTRRHAAGDPTQTMDAACTPDGAIRVGLAHGSLRSFGSDGSTTHNLIAPDRAETAGLAYLALGDWHGAQSFGPRSWYSGTPEPDGFDLGGGGGGEVLLVTIDGPRALPAVERHRVGGFLWRREAATLHGVTDIDVLETRLRGLHPDLHRVLVSLKVEGTLSLAGRQTFNQRIAQELRGALRLLRIDDAGLRAEPTAADLAAIDHAGFVRDAAERLSAMAANPAEPRHDLAAAALQRLYSLQFRHEERAP